MMRPNLLVLLLVCWARLPAVVVASRILIANPYGTKSHQNMYAPLIRALSARGHHLTIITNYALPEHAASENVTEIALVQLAIDMDQFPNMFDALVDASIGKTSTLLYAWIASFFVVPAMATEAVYQDPRVKHIMASEQFDVILVSQSNSIVSYPLVWHFKVPMILYSPNMLFPGAATSLGDGEQFSYAPFFMSRFTDKMTLVQRALNVIFSKTFETLYYRWHQTAVQSIVQRLGISDCPDLYEIEKNTSLVLINTHPSFSYQRALPPQIVPVGGMHCRPANPLPSQLESFVNSSDAGFILFAVGSTLRMEDMSDRMMESFINTFARLPQKVIWQWKGAPRPHLPSNILPIPWLPQQDLLGHRGCRAFLTHGGLNSLQEAVYHRVPLLGLPFGTDQHLNLVKAANDGYAIKLEWKDVTEETLSNAIRELVNNQSYSNAARKLSNLFRDQLETPVERAVFWTEFVIRHKGAHHLRLGSRDLSPVQRSLIDVYLVLVFGLLTLTALGLTCLKQCMKKIGILRQTTNKLSY